MRRKIVAGNWKMNKNLGDAKVYLEEFLPAVKEMTDVDIVLCAPFTLLHGMSADLEGTNVTLGAQNIFYEDKGAFTGECSPSMIREFCGYVLVGHSERRTHFFETDEIVNKKIGKALDYGFKVIFCLGETLDEREKGVTTDVVKEQLAKGLAGLESDQIRNIVVAYEPVWAIGTGKTATPEQAEEVHEFIRTELVTLYGEEIAQVTRIIYGGSVTPSNAYDILAKENIDGALPGGASLDPQSLARIIEAAL